MIPIIRATNKPTKPFNCNSKLSTAPNVPAITPNGSPKFSPHPDCIMGISDSIRTEYIPNLVIISLMVKSSLSPAKGAIMSSSSKNNVMINLAIPTFFIIFCKLVIAVHLPFIKLDISHQKSEICGWFTRIQNP